jgi:hypothetical protein
VTNEVDAAGGSVTVRTRFGRDFRPRFATA